jgi:excisionase family DNA binding protein
MALDAGAELTVRQAARRVGRAEETVRRWIWSGRLPARKHGNIYIVYADDVDAVAAGGHFRRERTERHPVSMTEWLDEVARWKATLADPRRSTAIDVWRENREHLEERANWILEHDRR